MSIMNQPEPQDPLDIRLREQNQYLDDNGFTARVLAGLPRRRPGRRPALLLGMTAIGLVLAAGCLPWKDLSLLAAPDSPALAAWTLVLPVMASLAWAAVAALQWED
jgi:hypothetical protein